MKLGQNVCLDEISNECENEPCGVKTRSLVQILEKLCVRSFEVCVISIPNEIVRLVQIESICKQQDKCA